MAHPNSSAQSAPKHVNSTSDQIAQPAPTASKNPSTHPSPFSTPSLPITNTFPSPRCMTPKLQSPLTPVCTHEPALRTSSCACQPRRPTLDSSRLPSEASSPGLASPPYTSQRGKYASFRADPIGKLDETTVKVEVELSSEAAKKAESSLWWRVRK